MTGDPSRIQDLLDGGVPYREARLCCGDYWLPYPFICRDCPQLQSVQARLSHGSQPLPTDDPNHS